MNPFVTFWSDILYNLKHMGVKIIESITGKTATGYVLFWQNKGSKKSSL